MNRPKYYLWGNGHSCWTIDMRHGRGHFEKVREFRVKSQPKQNDSDEAQRRRQTNYLKCKVRATEYLIKQVAKTGIPVIGGPLQ